MFYQMVSREYQSKRVLHLLSDYPNLTAQHAISERHATCRFNSAGRVLPLQGRSREFEPLNRHYKEALNLMCRWVRFFGNYAFTGSCGIIQGINIRPKQVTCPRCKGRIQRFIEGNDRVVRPVTNIVVKKGIAYYFTE